MPVNACRPRVVIDDYLSYDSMSTYDCLLSIVYETWQAKKVRRFDYINLKMTASLWSDYHTSKSRSQNLSSVQLVSTDAVIVVAG